MAGYESVRIYKAMEAVGVAELLESTTWSVHFRAPLVNWRDSLFAAVGVRTLFIIL